MDDGKRSILAEIGRALLMFLIAFAVAAGLAMLSGWFKKAHGATPESTRIAHTRVVPPDRIEIRFEGAAPRAEPGNFRVAETRSPDIALPVTHAAAGAGGRVTLTIGHALRKSGSYRLEVADPPLTGTVKPSAWALLLGVLLSSALINNFVFTRYLGLCIFFGITRKRDAAIGMGATFLMVMVTTGMLSWLIYAFVLKPLQLGFLQILVFIGVVAFLVQMLDTVLKKTHAGLHKKFGIYLMLITTNCIILAVPLLNAAADSGPLESFALAMGSGLGFALALFLMSSARERLELARVPASFEGLPIAFAMAGLFALAFMGFSGLDSFR